MPWHAKACHGMPRPAKECKVMPGTARHDKACQAMRRPAKVFKGMPSHTQESPATRKERQVMPRSTTGRRRMTRHNKKCQDVPRQAME
eukprot:6861618-Alexandrium_andersonii.AAC.1